MSLFALAVLVLAALPASLVVHELAHVLAARALGGRDLRIDRRGVGVHVSAAFPDGAMRAFAFVAAGPVASVVIGAAACMSSVPALVAMGAVSVAFGLLCACGHDGRELVRLARGMRGMPA